MSNINHNLLLATRSGNVEEINRLLSMGADVNYFSESMITYGSKAGDAIGSHFTPLMVAAKNGRLEALKTLIDHSSTVNYHNIIGHGALYEAVYSAHLDCIKYLVAQGADVHKKDHGRNTPFAVNCTQFDLENFEKRRYQIRLEIASFLLSHNAEIDTRTFHQRTPLMECCKSDKSNLPMVILLIENGASLKAVDYEGKSALDFALENNRLDLAEYLKSVLENEKLQSEINAPIQNSTLHF